MDTPRAEAKRRSVSVSADRVRPTSSALMVLW